jgi:hypothetical protein
MEVAMTRHTLSAIAAAALVSAFASSPASAQSPKSNTVLGGHHELMGTSQSGKPTIPAGLAAPRAQHGTTTHYPIRWWHDYSSR